MGLDKRGVWRGKCKKCKCEEFKEVNVRCECKHVPTAHEVVENGGTADVEARQPLSSQTDALKQENSNVESPHVTTDDHQELFPSSSKQTYCITCRSMYLSELEFCPYCPQELCKNPTCKKIRFTDALYGHFDYCSPSCRDKDLLPEYNKKLERDLNEGYSSYVRSNSSSPIESDGKGPSLPKARSTPPLARSAIVTNNSLTYATVVSQHSEHGEHAIKCRKLFRVPAGVKPSPEPAGSLQDCRSNTKTFYGSGRTSTPQGGYSGQRTRTEVTDLSNIHLLKTEWNKDRKTGLLVTGLTVGNETTWQWLDVITGIINPKKEFDETMSFCDMMTCIKKSALLTVHRDKDFKAIAHQIKKKVRNKDNTKAFFILKQLESQEYGLSQLNDEKLVLLKVTPGSAADQCGIKDNDILQFFGVVHSTMPESFVLTEVKKKDAALPIQEAFCKLKSSPNSVGLVLVVKRIGTKTLA